MFDSSQPPEDGEQRSETGLTPMQKFAAGRALVTEVSMPVLIASLIGIFTYSTIAFMYDVSLVMALAVFLLSTSLMTIVLLPKKEE